MENFQIENSSQSLFTQVINLENKFRAMTSIYIIINGVFIVDAVAQSDPHENGNIDLDHINNKLWKNLGLANTYVGNKLIFITTIYGLPTTVNSNEKAKEYFLANNPMIYKLKQSSLETFNLNEDDNIVLNSPQTAIAYKIIEIL